MSGFLLLLLSVLSFAVSVEMATVKPSYFPHGGNLTLELRPPPAERITNIVWKFQDNLLAEWVENKVPLDYYSTFVGRTTLDITTGRLVIDKMSPDDAGLYSVAINNKFQSVTYEAILAKDVPRPEVWISPLNCGPGSGNCTKKCEAVTTETGPVTYSWEAGDGSWEQLGKEVIFTEDVTKNVKTFSCRINNRFSEKESEPKDNPFYKAPVSIWGVVVGVIVGVVGSAGVVAVVAAYILKKGPFKNRASPDTTAGNGSAQPQPKPSPTPSRELDSKSEEIPLKTEKETA